MHMYNMNTAVFKSAIKFTHRTSSYPVRRKCATGAPPPGRGRRAHLSPRAFGETLARRSACSRTNRWGRGTASFISGGTLRRILTADHMDTCREHGRSAVIERAYTCAVGSTITVVAHSFVQVSPRIAHT